MKRLDFVREVCRFATLDVSLDGLGERLSIGIFDELRPDLVAVLVLAFKQAKDGRATNTKQRESAHKFQTTTRWTELTVS